jgi:hypothetical protein
MKRYGIDELAVAALFEAQGGVCAICGVEGPTHVDHAHTSGQIRGLVCFSCNRGLGTARDDVTVLKLAIEYLMYTSE